MSEEKERTNNTRSDEFDENKYKITKSEKNNHSFAIRQFDAIRCTVYADTLLYIANCWYHIIQQHANISKQIFILFQFFFFFFYFLSFAWNVLHYAFNAWLLSYAVASHKPRSIGWYTTIVVLSFVMSLVACRFHNWECMQLKLISVFIQSVNRTADERDTRQCEKVLTIIIFFNKNSFLFNSESNKKVNFRVHSLTF